jgi:ATP-dependent DNA helicase DinG
MGALHEAEMLTTITANPYLTAFPRGMVPRPEQAAILEKMPRLGTRDLLINAPTGIGKSALAIAIATAEGGGFLLSLQTSHIDQYAETFHSLQPGRASSSHRCPRGGLLATCRDKHEQEDQYCSDCRYVVERDLYLAGPISCATLSYHFQRAQHPDEAKRPKPRSVMVIDEAHALERTLVDYEGYTCSLGAARVLEITLPMQPATEPAETRHPAILAWLGLTLIPAQGERLKDLELEIATATHRVAAAKDAAAVAKSETDKLVANQKLQAGFDLVRKLRRERYGLQSDHEKCKLLIDRDPRTIVAWSTLDLNTKALTGVAIKPLEVRSAFSRLIKPFGGHVVLLSATLNPYFICDTLGLPLPGPGSSTAYMTCPSPFPSSNHRIVCRPVGDMGARFRLLTMPALLRMIERILNCHMDQKGIIHGQTHATVRAIQQHFANTEHAGRLLVVDRDGEMDTSGKLVRHHIEFGQRTVLLSPSMQEGVDLPGESSTFQVICQVPFPDLSDPWTKQRSVSPHGRKWYAAQTAQTLTQALGRSVRSETDQCVSYILDSRFERFYGDWEELFPDHIRKSLKEK